MIAMSSTVTPCHVKTNEQAPHAATKAAFIGLNAEHLLGFVERSL